jgi:hypothetical protein
MVITWRQWCAIAAFLVLTLLFSRAAASVEIEFHSEISAWGGPFPVAAFADDWRGPLRHGQQLFYSHQLAAAIHLGRLRLRAFERDWRQIRLNDDTAALLYRNYRSEPFASGRYRVDLQVEGIQSRGVALGYAWQWHGLTLTPAITWHEGRGLLTGSLSGEMAVNEENAASGWLELDYRYRRDTLFMRPLRGASGQGLGLDLTITWQQPLFELNLQIDNLAGHIGWLGVDTTQARADTRNRFYDDRGFVIFRSMLTGRHQQLAGWQQPLPILAQGEVTLKGGALRGLAAGVSHNPLITYPWLGYSFDMGGKSVQLRHYPTLAAWGAVIRGTILSASLITDHYNTTQSRVLIGSLNLRLGW